MSINFGGMQAAFFLYSFFFSSAILYTLVIAVSERTFLMTTRLFLVCPSLRLFMWTNEEKDQPTRQHVLDRAVRSISFTSAELCFGFGCMYLERFPFFLSLTLHTSTFAPFAYMYVLAFIMDFLFFSSMVFLQVPRVVSGWIDLNYSFTFLETFSWDYLIPECQWKYVTYEWMDC